MSRVEPARSPAVAPTWPERLPGAPSRRAAAVARPAATDVAAVGRRRGDLYGVLILLMLTGIVALDGIQQQRLLFRTDIVTAYLPWYAHLGERLRDLDIPGWLPYSFSGAPFAGDPESGWMYLPAMVIFTIAPGVGGFNAFILFHLVVAGLATYTLARLLGMSVLGAVVAGAAFEFGGFFERTRCCTVQAQVGMWLPVAFVGVEMAVRARTWLARLGWWSLAGLSASQMLTGALGQFAYYGMLAVGAYAIYRTLVAPPTERSSVRSRLVNAAAHGGAILAIGLGLAAGGIWPRVEVVGRSLLSDGDYGEVGRQMNGWSLPVLVDRIMTIDDRGGRWYAGGAVMALALLAPLVARRRFSAPFWVVYTLFALALASREFWLHELLFLLPQFAELHRHLPERALTIFYIGPALLAGATVSALARPAVGRHRLALLGLLPIGLLLLLWDVFTSLGDAPHRITVYSLSAVAVLIALAAAFRHPVALRLIGIGLLVAVFADPTGRLVTFRLESPKSTSFIKAFHGPSDVVVAGYTEVTPAARELQRLTAEAGQPVRYVGYDPAMLYADGQQRTYVARYWERQTYVLLVNNRSVLLGLEDLQGYNPVQSARYVALMDAINGTTQSYHQANILYRGISSPILPLLNARYILIPATVPPGRPDLLHLSQRYPTVYADADVRIVENLDALPRAWIVHDAQRVSSDRVYELLDDGRVDPATEVLLEKDAERPPLETPADPAAERVAVTDYRPDEVSLAVTMTAPGLVVLSETYDPGWRAYVDGERVPVLAAFGALRAVPVPAGDHTLELRYEPPSIVLSLFISLGTAALLSVAAGVLLWRRSIGRPVLVGHRVEGWLAPGAGRWGLAGRGVGERLGRAAAVVAALPVGATLGGLTAAGGVIRLIGLRTVAPNLEDRLTISAGTLPWSAVLGRDGLDPSAPPLFVAAVKLLDLLGIQRLAEPAVSAAAGALTIPVVYLVATRLLGHRVGLAAAALLAVSPVHVALSRSGEPMGAGLLLVAVSYLALVGLIQTGERAWLAIYSASLVVSLYTDPTTAYALAPQLVVGLALLRRGDRRAGGGILAAAGLATVAAIPWLLHLRDAADWLDLGRGRDDYLTALWPRLIDALPLTAGLEGLGSWLRADPPVWVPPSALVMLAGALPVGIAGVAALRGRPAAAVCKATMLGAPILAVLASQLADGFTVVALAPALIGWSILASAWLARGVDVDVRRWGAIGWTVLLLSSLAAIPAAYDAGRGEPWRDATPALTSQAHLGLPILVENGDALADRTTVTRLVGDRGAVDGSGRWLDDPAYEQIDATELGDALASADRPVQAFWLLPRSGAHLLEGPIEALGFGLVMAIDLESYGAGMDGRLELWARPGAAVGEPVPIDGGFQEPVDRDDTWRLSGSTSLEETSSGGRTLTISGPASRATYRLPGGPGLYLVETEVWTAGPTVGRVTVKCADADEADLVKQTAASPETGTAGAWRPVAAAVLCPEGTTSLAVVLDRRGDDGTGFRGVTLRASPTDYPTTPPLGEEELEAPEDKDGESTEEELAE